MSAAPPLRPLHRSRLDGSWVYDAHTGSYARADTMTPEELVAAWADGLQLLQQAAAGEARGPREGGADEFTGE